MENLPKSIGQKVQKNIEPETKEYRDNLSNTLQTVRRFDPATAEGVLNNEKETNDYTSSNEDIRYQSERVRFMSKMEDIVSNLKHGEFNEVKVDQEIDTDKMEELGFSVQEQVYVSLGRGAGVEMLAALEKELEKKDSLKVYCVNEGQNLWNGVEANMLEIYDLPIPFEGLQVADGPYKTSIVQVMELAQEDVEKIEKERDNSSYKILGKLALQIKANPSNLLSKWVEYLKDNFEKTGTSTETYQTHDSYMGDSRSHSRVEQKRDKLQELYTDFLQNHGVELIKANKDDHDENDYSKPWHERDGFGEYKKNVPIATKSYNLLLSRDSEEYSRNAKKHLESRGDRRGQYEDSIAIEILSRPKSITDDQYDTQKKWFNGREDRYKRVYRSSVM